MKATGRTIAVLLAGIVAGAAAFSLCYVGATRTHREMLQGQSPELAWLKTEFRLGDKEFEEVRKLHEGYLPECRERCRELEQISETLRRELAGSTNVTAAVQSLLSDRARMVAECQAAMLKHFFEVSRAMPPEQGRRYLAWVQQETCLRESRPESGSHRHDAGQMP